MSSNQARPKPELANEVANGPQHPPRISPFLIVGGSIAVATTVVGVVVLAALTSWWVLLALFAVCPLMMAVCGPVMMTAMRDPAGGGFSAAGWCSPFRRPEGDRATWAG